jgi:hypothetical protein
MACVQIEIEGLGSWGRMHEWTAHVTTPQGGREFRGPTRYGIQLDCFEYWAVRRELAVRGRFYAKLRGTKGWSEQAAAHQMKAVQAVLTTLEGLREN